ncbi:MAG: FliH/SctL family protein [Clostridia bacterium]|nr:FliH/SctL family protein [Clostridia bacterium]
MSSKIFKNYQVNVGMPFQIRSPFQYQAAVKESRPVDTDRMEEDRYKTQEESANIVAKAREDAEMIIKEAQYEAMRLIENTQQEMEEFKRNVEEEARQQGYEHGFTEAQKQYQDLIQEAEITREHAMMEYKQILEGIEQDAVSVILEVARKVIGAEISFNKEDLLYLVKEAFEHCTHRESVTLKVSPDDYAYLTQNKDKLLSMVQGMGDLEIKKDASLSVGACILETPYGSIDAGVNTKLKKIEEAFRELIGK